MSIKDTLKDTLKEIFQTKSQQLKNQKETSYAEHCFDFSSQIKTNYNIDTNRNYYSFCHAGYIRNPIVFRAVNLIAHTTSAIDLILIESKADHHFYNNKHILKDLIDRPNPFSSKVDFIEAVVYNLLIGGNAFILMIKNLSGTIKELYVLDQNQIEILTDNTNSFVIGYQYDNGVKVQKYKIDQETGQCDILHIKNFNPLDNIYGLSPFEAATNFIDQHNLMISWNKSLLLNSSRPSGVLASKNSLNSEQKNVLKRDLYEFNSDPSNVGRPMILDSGLEWKSGQTAPKDLDFINFDKVVVRHIANAFGVPVQLLNDPESSSYNNYLEAKRALYENTVLPLLNKILSSIFNNWICPIFGKNFTLSYREEDIPALSYKYEQKLKNLHESNFLTINEKRRIAGFDPINGGDILDYKK